MNKLREPDSEIDSTEIKGNLSSSNLKTTYVEITYCTQCRWLLRAAWLAQELLTTFEHDLTSVALKPGTSGIFEVKLNGILLFSRKEAGRFPEAKEIKQLIRDQIDPARDLGHSDKPKNEST